MPTSHAEIIDLWDSITDLAADLDQKADTVRRWRLRSAIPSAFWTGMEEAAKRRGLKGVNIRVLAGTAPPRGAVGRPPNRTGEAA